MCTFNELQIATEKCLNIKAQECDLGYSNYSRYIFSMTVRIGCDFNNIFM